MDHLRCAKYLTTTQDDFSPIKNAKRTVLCPKIPQKDEALISGHPFNNLKVKNIQHKTKTWPQSMDWREDYKQFLVRLKMYDECLYRRIFEDPNIDYSTIEQMLKDERYTTYGVTYSPNGYVSMRAQKEVYRTSIPVAYHDYYTTYSNSYNRPNKEPRFKDKTKSVLFRPAWDAGDYAKVMRKHFKKYNYTTYFAEICFPIIALDEQKLPPAIIDRYDLRKL